MKNVEKFAKTIKILKFVIGTLLFVYLIDKFQYKGLVGFVTFIIVIAMYKVYIYRDNFIQGIKTIEGMIWKKPLDKELWDKGELKNTKVKVVWRKKNGKQI